MKISFVSLGLLIQTMRRSLIDFFDFLVLADPAFDVGHLDVSGFGDGGWVLIVGRSKVKMVRTTLDVQRDATAVGRHVLVEAACTPRVKLTVREDDVGGRKEVLLDVEATEVAQRPVVIWREAERVLAQLGVAVEVKLLLDEHGVGAVSDWHGQLVAGEDVPAVAIQVTRALPIAQVGARILTSVVEVDIGGLGEGLEELSFTRGQPIR